MASDTIQEFFCLNGNRSNFDLDPATDSDFLFGDPIWAEDVDKRLQRSHVMGRPLRLIWWGQYGIGKTHRLRYAKKIIEKKGYPYYPCYATLTDLDDKTGFERFQSQLIGAIGYEKVRGFTEAYILRVRNKEAGIRDIKEVAEDAPDVAHAIESLGGLNDKAALAGWRYLSGHKLSAQEMGFAQTSKPEIDTSQEFAAVHAVLAHIIDSEAGGKKLVYLVDEVENLAKIKNKNAAARWQETIRCLLDVKDLGLVMTVGAENQQGIPSILLQPDLVRRIQKDNYQPMAAYKTATAERFVRDLLKVVINPVCRAAKETSNGWVDGAADYESALYPFTKSAFEVFCNHATNDPRSAKPSEILNSMNNAAYEALVAGGEIITVQILNHMDMS